MSARNRLVFVGDPMCSWCYGFAKELSLLATRHPDLPIDIRVGGVSAYATEPMSEEMKRFRLSHWHRVEKASGLPFNREAFMQLKKDFVYDTEPACRAIVVLRQLAPEASALGVFRAIQDAFYTQGRDTTDGAVLAAVASGTLAEQGFNVTPEHFLTAWGDAGTIALTAAEFKEVRRWGVSSFPTLLLQQEDKLSMLAPGYMSVDELDDRLGKLVEHR